MDIPWPIHGLGIELFLARGEWESAKWYLKIAMSGEDIKNDGADRNVNRGRCSAVII